MTSASAVPEDPAVAVAFGVWLRREMELRHQSLGLFSVKLGVRVHVLNAWLSGRSVPSEATCARIAVFLGLPVWQMLEVAGHEPPTPVPY